MEGMFVRLFCQFWCGSEILDGCHHRALKFNIDCNMEHYIYIIKEDYLDIKLWKPFQLSLAPTDLRDD
jgi:hypothetical protein